MKPLHQKRVLLALSRYYHEIHHGVARFAAQHEWHLNCDMAISGVLPNRWQGDGILTLLADRPEVVSLVKKTGLPVVDLAMGRPDINVPRVSGDNSEIARIAAAHFLERGFQNFAWFSSRPGCVANLRRNVFFQTVRSRAKTRLDLTYRPRRSRDRADWAARLSWLVQNLKAAPRPLAVFAFRDADAANVLDACLNAGIGVPDEIAILGIGNNEIICESVRIPLSSVRHNLEQLGFAGAQLLDQLMRGLPKPKQPILIVPQGIRVRRSTDSLAVSDPKVMAALRFLRDNIRHAIGPSEAAQAIGVSRWHLEAAFREQLGHTVRVELSRRRLAHARDLLVGSDLPVAEIAARSGFNTPQYFNNVFRSEFGVTPGKFRRARQSG